MARALLRLHRLFGSAFALLLLIWFVSGAVMTFADFPSFSEAERLASAPVLPRGAQLALPPALASYLSRAGLARGQRPRLALIEGQPTWVSRDEQGVRRAYRSQPPLLASQLDEARAAAEASRRTSRTVAAVERIDEPDQWSVGLARPGTLPLYRIWLDDQDSERGLQVYLSARTGEIVQASVRSERTLAWLGAIPHWIYPTLLRRERALWRATVLTLSALALLVSLSGTGVGLVLWLRRRRKNIQRPVPDPVLRWHHRLGLGFGLFVSSWVFSGALSLAPFDWTGDHGLGLRESNALYGVASPDSRIESPATSSLRCEAADCPVSAALATCQRELEVRELELTSFAGSVYAVCYASETSTRVVDLSAPQSAVHSLARAPFERLAEQLAVPGQRAQLSEQSAYDLYYYPTHRDPRRALPYMRLDLNDADQTSLYFDPARAELTQRSTRLGRLERWLYHGLHSFDVPGLYARTALWRTLVIGAMVLGASLAALGLTMTVRKILRRRRRRSAPS